MRVVLDTNVIVSGVFWQGKPLAILRAWAMTFLQDRIELIQPTREFKLCRDPMDDVFLNCAVAAQATCIVSGDEDLLVLKAVEGIPILKVAEFTVKHPDLF